jgi:hypothetical protein
MKRLMKRVRTFLIYTLRRVKGTEKVCTKKNPFVPPLKYGVYWTHKDAKEKYPEHDFSIVVYHCPNCGIDFEIDWGD